MKTPSSQSRAYGANQGGYNSACCQKADSHEGRNEDLRGARQLHAKRRVATQKRDEAKANCYGAKEHDNESVGCVVAKACSGTRVRLSQVAPARCGSGVTGLVRLRREQQSVRTEGGWEPLRSLNALAGVALSASAVPNAQRLARAPALRPHAQRPTWAPQPEP